MLAPPSSVAGFTTSSSHLLTSTTPRPVIQHELKNGLRLLLLEDHSAPVVSVQYWIETGSIHEGTWLGAGLSHLLEHLMFKGTPTRGNSEMAQGLQDLGGHLNAYTSFDRTVYYVDLPAVHWRGALDILTDAMQHSTLPIEEFAKEQEVIRREFAMGEDSPDRQLSHLLFRTAFTRHPYRFPIIGHLDLFNQLTRDDVMAYYRSRYVPQNMTLLVVGAIQAEEVIAQAERLWQEEPRRPLADLYLPSEPAQHGARFATKAFPTEVTRLALVHHIPGLDHEDIPALEVLAMIFGGGRSARLLQRCVEKFSLAEEIDAFAYVPGRHGLWGIEARCHPSRQEQLLAAIRSEIALMQEEGPTPEELARAQRLSVLHQVHSMKTMAGQAASLGRGWLLSRDPHFSHHFLQQLQHVTAEQVIQVSRNYLTSTRETLVELVPLAEARKQLAAQREPEVDSAVQKIPHSAPWSTLYVPAHKLPLVSFRATFGQGLLSEPPGRQGLGRLAAQLLIKGTKRRSAEALAQAVEQLGGSMGADGGTNSASVAIELLAQDWERGLDLFLEVLTEPKVTEAELATEKRKQIAAWQVEQDHPMAVARQLVRDVFFTGHPYQRSALGTPETVQAITVADVENYIRDYYFNSSLVFGASGAVTPDQWLRLVTPRLSTLPSPLPALVSPTLPTWPTTVERREKIHPKEQAVMLFAFPTAPLSHPDHISLALLSEALSDLGSRLFVKIREELGLAYFVGAAEFLGRSASIFYFYVGTDPHKRPLIEAEMLKQIHQLGQHGLTPEELDRARAKQLSQEQLAAQNPSQVLASAALDELIGLGYDFEHRRQERLAKITLEEVNQAAKTYFQQPGLVLATVSPA